MANTTEAIFTIYDSKSKTHSRPFFDYNQETAKRQFGDLANNAERATPYFKFPEDFSLFYWGEFDCMSSPHWNMLETAKHICNAIDLKEEPARPAQFAMTNGRSTRETTP